MALVQSSRPTLLSCSTLSLSSYGLRLAMGCSTIPVPGFVARFLRIDRCTIPWKTIRVSENVHINKTTITYAGGAQRTLFNHLTSTLSPLASSPIKPLVTNSPGHSLPTWSFR